MDKRLSVQDTAIVLTKIEMRYRLLFELEEQLENINNGQPAQTILASQYRGIYAIKLDNIISQMIGHINSIVNLKRAVGMDCSDMEIFLNIFTTYMITIHGCVSPNNN